VTFSDDFSSDPVENFDESFVEELLKVFCTKRLSHQTVDAIISVLREFAKKSKENRKKKFEELFPETDLCLVEFVEQFTLLG